MSAFSNIDALRAAVSAEHAAIFGYGVVGGHLSGQAQETARQAERLHRGRRDAAALRLQAVGGEMVAAQPAYQMPVVVTDAHSAMALAAQLEDGTAGAWREALSATTGDDRALALDGLIVCAVMATRWRLAAQIQPATVAFPGSA